MDCDRQVNNDFETKKVKVKTNCGHHFKKYTDLQ